MVPMMKVRYQKRITKQNKDQAKSTKENDGTPGRDATASTSTSTEFLMTAIYGVGPYVFPHGIMRWYKCTDHVLISYCSSIWIQFPRPSMCAKLTIMRCQLWRNIMPPADFLDHSELWQTHVHLKFVAEGRQGRWVPVYFLHVHIPTARMNEYACGLEYKNITQLYTI